jgi:hypothetical protein
VIAAVAAVTEGPVELLASITLASTLIQQRYAQLTRKPNNFTLTPVPHTHETLIRMMSRSNQEEFQSEREDMLDTIRQLSKQVKLKEVIIVNFVPPEEERKIEKRAVWQEEASSWTVPRADISGNALKRMVARPVSIEGLRRPETEYARQRKQYDPNPRYK